jgi:acetyl-CoA carboxylase biotin carboxylase subunit
VRIDTAAYAEGVIPPYYDSLYCEAGGAWQGSKRSDVANVTSARDVRMCRAFYTTIPLHRKILADPEFRAGNVRYQDLLNGFLRDRPRQRPRVSNP